jgi:class 3 adenylate cyclase
MNGRAQHQEVAVGFADLAGYTALTALRLVELAEASLDEGVRLVKTVGDGVLLAGSEPGALLATVISLCGAVESTGRLPRARDRSARRLRSSVPGTCSAWR